MGVFAGYLRKKFDAFRDDRGGITVEAVLWLPFYLLFFGLIADVSMMFHSQSKAQRIAQDVNRLAVLSWLEDQTEMQGRAERLVHSFSPNATITTYDNTDSVQTFITMPASDLQPMGLISTFFNFDVSVSAAHIKEL